MKKGIIGFLVGLFILAVGFVCTVSIMASEHDRTFTEEMKSWGDSKEEEVVIPDNTTGENTDTETTAIISISDGGISLKI